MMAVYAEYDYDGGRPGSRTLAVAAAAVAALCVVFLAGYASRGGAAVHAAAPPGRPVTPVQMPTSAPATSTSSSPATARDPGGLHTNADGVIVGYARSQGGAVAAAGNYTAALYVQTNRTNARELSVLGGICASAGDAVRLAGDFSSEDAALAKLLDTASLQSPGVIAYGHPLGYRAQSYSPTAATVDVYVVGGQGMAGVPGDSGVAGETFYEVDEVDLSWRDGDWRLDNWSHLVQDNGPQLASVAADSYAPFPLGQASAA